MKKYDSLLKRAEEFEKLAVYGDRATFLQAIAQGQIPVPQATLTGPTVKTPGSPGTPGGRKLTLREQLSGVEDKPLKSWKDMVTKEDAPAPPATVAPTAPSVSKETQDQLNQILVPYGKILPIKVDGILGPETQKAISEFKKTYSKPGTADAIKEVYLQVKNPGLVTKAPF
jgi:hypothetical protein